MALPKDFPQSPHAILDPSIRWFPADEALRETTMDKLMPPLVPALRRKVKKFREGGYVGATQTSKSLLNWWFTPPQPHLIDHADGSSSEFKYFFAQREALETIVYLIDVVGVKDKFDLMRFDGSGAVSAGMFDETWRRFVVKMAKDITTGLVTHTTVLDTAGVADYRSVIGYFAQTVMKELRLVSGYDMLYGKMKAFVQGQLFDHEVELESPNTIRNLSELTATKTLIEAFKKAINALTVQDKGDAQIRDTIKLRQVRPFVVKDQGYLIPKKSVFNRIIGDSSFELDFAAFLDNCAADDVISYAKNYLAVHFQLDYVNADGDISNYYPGANPSRTKRTAKPDRIESILL